MLDSDLAALYEVETGALNRAVKRNIERFPDDFMFQLTKDELTEVMPNWHNLQNLKFRPTLPFVFTGQGVAMLASVLNSKKAIDVNISIIRAFVKLRQFVISDADVNAQILELRKLLLLYIETNDKRVNEIILALNNLIEQPPQPKKKIGF
jgi:intracellular sulfur oxidation DsrE/DsrF family protein